MRLFDTHNEWANFSNSFWSLDFNLEYYKKKVDEASDSEKSLMSRLYMNALEAMSKLLEKGSTGGFRKRKVKKTRKVKRKL